MAAVLQTLLKRQLGFNCSSKRQLLDARLQLLTLLCKDEDAPRIAENEDNLFESIPIYDIKFCPINFHPHLMAVTDELGYVSIVNTAPGIGEYDKIMLKEQCHENALFNMDWSPHADGVLATCSGDQSVKVWDIKKDFGNVATCKGHERTVKSVRFHPSNRDCLVSCGRDGTIRFWDTRSGESAVNIIKQAHGAGAAKDVHAVTDVLFHNEVTVISCGSSDGIIKMWDLRKTYSGLKKMIPVSTVSWESSSYDIKGYHSMCLDNQNNLYASTSREIHKFNLSTEEGQTNPAHFVPPNALNYYIKINTSPDDRFLISGSSLAEAYVWDTFASCVEPFMVLANATTDEQMSASVALFCPCDHLKIVTGNDEGKIHIWRPNFAESKDRKNSTAITNARNVSEEEINLIQNYCEERSIGGKQLDVDGSSANEREAEVARLKMHSSPTTFKKLSLLTSDSYSSRVESRIDLGSLLKDLPNFVMDGTHPSVINSTPKCATPVRKTCWLGELKLLKNGVVSPSNNNNNIDTKMANGITSTESNFSANISVLHRNLKSVVSIGEKRPPSVLASSTNDNQPQAKKIKLKLKVLTTPKRSPKPRIQSGSKNSSSRGSGPASGGFARRASADSPAHCKSPSHTHTPKILKYFVALERDKPLHLPTESASS